MISRYLDLYINPVIKTDMSVKLELLSLDWQIDKKYYTYRYAVLDDDFKEQYRHIKIDLVLCNIAISLIIKHSYLKVKLNDHERKIRSYAKQRSDKFNAILLKETK